MSSSPETFSLDPSSSSSSNNPRPPLPISEYEVFLSFRGPDVRQTFADHLYSCFARSKIRTFRDEEELRKGEVIAPSLVRAIKESKIHIPIFTENYAASKWCLQELAQMVRCWKERKGHIILPIFYFVDPRDVRHQIGPYWEAFEQHSLKHDLETTREWRESLQEVGKMKGWHITKSSGEGAMIDQIFTEVELRLRTSHTLLVTDQLVGVNFHVQEVMRLLTQEFADERMVGIYGMGGLGKTTIAKAVYNKVNMHFDRCCFIENIRQILSENGGVEILQNKIISSILKNDREIKDTGDRIHQIKNRVCKHKILIVLDDVDGMFQFEEILGNIGNFSSESRFIVTTRDRRVLEFLQVYKSYELKEMSRDHSLQLFSKHAFRMDYPPEDYVNLSDEFVQVAAGLPLALKVIGSLLFQTNLIFWEQKLAELKEIPAAKVQERLKISFNELTYNEKQIFLDIACFFVGVNKESPIFMWSDCDFYPGSAIRTLVLRSLIRINEKDEFWMHDHIRDLGRAIVREENFRNPGKRSRVWSNKDALNMLESGEVCVTLVCIFVVISPAYFPLFGNADYDELTEMDLEQLTGLRYLEVRCGSLTGDFTEVLPNIRWLRLHDCDSIPTDMDLEKLIVLDMKDCPVKDSWRSWNSIKVAHNYKLKVANLVDCDKLEKPPSSLSRCESLELLDYSGCMSMQGELELERLKNLRVLRLCRTEITKLKVGGDIGMLPHLKEIDFRFTRLTEVPPGISKLHSLEILDVTACRRSDIESPVCLMEMLPPNLKRLAIVSFTLSTQLPPLLTHLEVGHSMQLERLSNNLASLSKNLTELRLYVVGIFEIHGLGELTALETLDIDDAPNLRTLDGLQRLVLLKELSVRECHSLGKLPSVANLNKLHTLEISGCKLLSEIHGLGELASGTLSSLEINDCPRLENIGGDMVMRLESLILAELQLTKLLPQSLDSCCTKLRSLTIEESVDDDQDDDVEIIMPLQRLPDLSGLVNLMELRISGCQEVVEVRGLDGLESLHTLEIVVCKSIRKLPDLSGLRELEWLCLDGCTQLTEVPGLGRLESLEYLSMAGCSSIKRLPDLSGLNNLTTLNVRKCPKLKELKGLERLEMLQVVETDKRLKVRHLLRSVARYGKRITRSVRGVLN
ncbi:unnamed protein product [Linum tenue]|uniref:TIR domain-containing protein n=1 Tax=Linum tenue TaxID=586396 RepID=A0AAV0PS06_9ROSI|nr:unnamed protein product [Linum tenue]